MALVEFSNVSKVYKNTAALDSVSFTLEGGQVVGILGPNGSGKTTLFKLMCAYSQPSSGQILIAGMAPGPKTKAVVSYLPDHEILPQTMSVEQMVRLYERFFSDFDAQMAREMISDLGLDFSAKPKALSKGMREKVQLCLSMARRAQVYLLDEPIGGVDPAARDYILRTIITHYRPDAAVVVATHLIADVEPILDDVIFLHKGHLVLHQSADELREQHNMSIDELFRKEFACLEN